MQHNNDLAGQQPFITVDNQQVEHLCERCQKPIKGRYRHCWRCHNYLQTKARIADAIRDD